jgi:hypothetical protein
MIFSAIYSWILFYQSVCKWFYLQFWNLSRYLELLDFLNSIYINVVSIYWFIYLKK